MCGIGGVYGNKITNEHYQMVKAIIKDQFARGPDHQRIETINGQQAEVILGHNRLSIIDLSNEANQPMWDHTHRYCISYNGEIYNYLELCAELKKAGFIFHTKSDTEVILNAFAYWGIHCLSHFHGPFAFALFDSKTEELWLCRDRFGVRPLYYVKENNNLYFASSTSILAKTLHLKPNLAYVARGLHYLVYEDNSDISPYHGLSSLPAGSYLRTTNISTVEQPYYDLKQNVEHLTHTLPIQNTDDLLQMLADLFENAVQIRLRADVPLGIAISSGLDSSSVAAMVRANHTNILGFSFGHPQQKKTEGPLVAKCAEFLNLKIEYIWPTQDEMVAALFQTIKTQDAPFSSLSIVAQYLLYKKIRETGIKVILGGQGGDESFMGYKKFLLFWLQDLFKQKDFKKTVAYIIRLLPMFFSEARSLSSYWQHRHRYIGRQPKVNEALQLPQSLLNLHDKDQSIAHRQIQDITQFSLPTLLRYEDRNAMGNSVESRLPFLDHRLVELGVAIPAAIKLRSGYSKWPIREIMRNKIPNQIRLARYKRGFDIPLHSLLHSGLGSSIREALHHRSDLIKPFLKRSQNVDQLFSDQAFLKRRSAMAEAISLLWLSQGDGL